ncbi:glycosyltransferase [Magnetospira sp. QH-2]|uniref:glycosyltransferase n=1 Tax=Magnetospira sp. (strain QH-2) TaxID=1288970 RepID=UPI0003E80D34|nr:glycosyltransferase [Magnetospira sp. QH-2]CCQ73896.1 GT4 : Lipopolysaccharide core biosynthesis glycosyltransferase lpsE [Magnetospira sp. QH-2]
MRVLQAMAGAKVGGAEAFFVRLAEGLQKTDLEQQVLIRRHPARAARLREAGVDVSELPFGGLLDVKTRLEFRRHINAFKPDIVLTWMNRATGFCPPKVHGGGFVHVARLGGYYNLKYYQHCDHLVGNTQDIVDYLIGEGWPKERAHYLPNFVDSSRKDPLPRREFSTPDHAPVILGLGRLHENKAFDVLIEAVARVPGTYLWIAGEGPERGKLESLAGHLGVLPRLRFLGWREDIPALFAATDLFVCSSRHEPLGNVVLEAWAQGRPVVAAASQGPAALIEDGVNGLLVDVDDAEAMARALRGLMEDPDRAYDLASQGYVAYQQNFTEQAVVARYLDFFRRMCG